MFSLYFPLYFLSVIFFSNDPFFLLKSARFYKLTKTRSFKTMVVLPRGFMEDSYSYSFSFKTFLSEIDGAWSPFCLLVN
jgi:hypothetical protein